MIDKILGSKSAPAYYSARRAWNVLGYFRRPKPEFDVFRQQIRMMWTYLNRVKTLRGRRAKAYILDALRALKLRNPKWKITMRELSIQPNDMEIPWNQIPAPCRATRNHPPDDAREYVTAPAPRVTVGELAAMTMVNEKVWERFHRYQGFRVQDAQENDVHLRAIPVPEGPDSLWHSVS